MATTIGTACPLLPALINTISLWLLYYWKQKHAPPVFTLAAASCPMPLVSWPPSCWHSQWLWSLHPPPKHYPAFATFLIRSNHIRVGYTWLPPSLCLSLHLSLALLQLLPLLHLVCVSKNKSFFCFCCWFMRLFDVFFVCLPPQPPFYLSISVSLSLLLSLLALWLLLIMSQIIFREINFGLFAI